MSRKHSPWWLYSQGSRTASSNTGIEELKEILKKLELSEYCDAFEKEKMDREALVRSSVIFFFHLLYFFFAFLPSPPTCLPGTESLAHETSLWSAAGAE